MRAVTWRLPVWWALFACALPAAAADRAADPAPDALRAFADWRIDWRYRLLPLADGRCRLQGVEHSLKTGLSLPADIGPALLDHEHGHLAIAAAAARAIAARLRDPAFIVDCGSLQAAVDRVMQSIIAEFRSRERHYDRRSAHGRVAVDPLADSD